MQLLLCVLKGQHILIGSYELIVISLEVFDEVELMILSG